MVSVIVPVYKAEKYLHRCVDSILAQSYADFELLLIDDGSPDNSGAICDEYAAKDSRVRVFHKENGGVSSARNLGLDNARGEWITFVDSDDYIEQDFLSIPNDVVEDLLIQNYKMFNIDNHVNVFKKTVVIESDVREFISENLHQEWLRTPWAKFFKTFIIKNNNIQFPIGVKIGEDALFVQAYLCHTKSVRYIASAAYMYKYDCDYDRYRLPAYKSVDIFHRFISNYERLKADSVEFLDFAFNFYWGMMNPKNFNKEHRVWYEDKVVKRIYTLVRKKRSIKWWVKYNLYKLLSQL